MLLSIILRFKGGVTDCDHLVNHYAGIQTSCAAVTLIISVAVGQTFISAELSVERACCEFYSM